MTLQSMKEQRDEFVARNGGVAVQVGTGWWTLPTGASISHNGFGPVFREAPREKLDRLRVQIQHWDLRIRPLVRAVKTLEATSMPGVTIFGFHWQVSEWGLPPMDRYGNEDHSAALEKLKGLLKQYQETLDGLNREWAEMFPQPTY